MEEIKIAIIGAGSSYTPEIIEGLVSEKNDLPVSELVFYDIDERRLAVVAGFCQRMLKRLGSPLQICTTTDRRQAMEGARFIIVQIRVGGNSQRVLDERIPMKYGLIGQETTGPGGMLKAFRTIPVLLDIAHEVEKINPDAWLINYTNPTGLVTEAVTRFTNAKIAGLCSGGLFPGWFVSLTLGVPFEKVRYRYFGLNHLNFAYDINMNNRPLTDAEFDSVADNLPWGDIDSNLIKTLHLIPSPYLQYYFHTSKCVHKAVAKNQTRGEEVLALEKEIFAAFADINQDSKPDALKKRGGGGYSQIALAVMKAIYTNQEKILIVNVPNNGAVKMLPDDAVLEIPCAVNSAGIFPLKIPHIPPAIWGLVSAVKNYEQLAVEAAVSGNRETALLALLAHPLVRDYDITRPLLEEMLESNRSYLPQFFKE